MNSFEQIKLEHIRINGGTQSRVSINTVTVADYADAMTDGATLPPVTLFFDGVDHWLADGFHRYHAHKKIGAINIDADVRKGDKRDAILYSVGANASHGLRRTNEDKHRAVAMLLNDPEWVTWSANEIAKKCGVSHTFVNGIKSSLEAVSSEAPSESTYTTKHGTKATMKTANIGKAKPTAPSQYVVADEPTMALDVDPAPENFGSFEDEVATELKAETDKLNDIKNSPTTEGSVLANALADVETLREQLCASRKIITDLQNENNKLTCAITSLQDKLMKLEGA